MNLLETLRPRLLAEPPERTTHDDYDLEPGHPPIQTAAAIKAAVLLPVVLRSEPMLLFTRRTERLAKHSGQVSFPGGRSDPADLSPIETALRETREETGIDPDFITVAGYLDRYLTGTGFDIQPVVGVLRDGFALVPNPAEVAEIFEVPLAFLLDPVNRRRETRELAGRQRTFYSIRHGAHEIWGATAAIIVNLAERLTFPGAISRAMKIDPAKHDWMTKPETMAVMSALGRGSLRGRRRAQCPAGRRRERYRHRRTDAARLSQLARLRAAGIQVIETGIDHGTVTAVISKQSFEVTSLRRDVETDGRHAVIAFTDDWAEDAARRDFTLNALYAAADGEIFDYASGMEDLIAGRVRFMGDAATRIAEDYLRVLRLFRFHAWYGKGEIEAEGLRAAAAAKDRLASLSAERIAKELLRLLEAPAPGPVLRVMAATGILPELLPGALQLPRLERLAELEADNFFPPDALLRLAALLPDGAARRRMPPPTALKLSSADRTRLEQAG